jgi:hypothetical protein
VTVPRVAPPPPRRRPDPLRVVAAVVLLVTLVIIIVVAADDGPVEGDPPHSIPVETDAGPEDAAVPEPDAGPTEAVDDVLARTPATSKKARLVKAELEKRAAEKRAAEKRAAEKRAAEKRAREARLASERDASPSGGVPVVLVGDAGLKRDVAKRLNGARVVTTSERGYLITLKNAVGVSRDHASSRCSAAIAELPQKKLLGSVASEAEVAGTRMSEAALKGEATAACAQSLAEDLSAWLRRAR